MFAIDQRNRVTALRRVHRDTRSNVERFRPARLGTRRRLITQFGQFERGKRQLRVRGPCVEQSRKVVCEALDRGCIEHIGGVGEREIEPGIRPMRDVEHQVELRLAVVRRLHRHVQRIAERRAEIMVLLLIDEHLEERRSREVALGLQCLDDARKRHVLVRVSAQQPLTHIVDQLPNMHCTVRCRAQHDGVDEKAGDVRRARQIAARKRHTDADVALAGVAIEQRVERCEQGHEERGLALVGQRAQRLGGRGRHTYVEPCARRAPRVGADAVEWQREQVRRFVVGGKFGAPPIQLGFLALGCEVRGARLHHVAVGDPCGSGNRRCIAALAGTTCGECAIEPRKVVEQQAHRPVVANDVMKHEMQHMLVVGETNQRCTHGRFGHEVERLTREFAQTRSQRCLFRACVRPLQIEQTNLCGRPGIHTLMRNALRLAEAHAQRRMTNAQRGECGTQRVHVEATVETQRATHVIGAAARIQLPDEPQAFLRCRERYRCAEGVIHDGLTRAVAIAFVAITVFIAECRRLCLRRRCAAHDRGKVFEHGVFE
ncbi:hypothetical protein JCM10599A_36710 [Paraburkholderia kururiensis]